MLKSLRISVSFILLPYKYTNDKIMISHSHWIPHVSSLASIIAISRMRAKLSRCILLLVISRRAGHVVFPSKTTFPPKFTVRSVHRPCNRNKTGLCASVVSWRDKCKTCTTCRCRWRGISRRGVIKVWRIVALLRPKRRLLREMKRFTSWQKT